MIKHFKPTIEQINNSIKKLVSIEYLKVIGNDIHYLPWVKFGKFNASVRLILLLICGLFNKLELKFSK